MRRGTVWARAGLLVACCAALAAGCGGGDDGPAAMPAAAQLRTTYTDAAGASRTVDAAVGPVAVHPPAITPPVPVPAGSEVSIVDVQVTDAGRNRLPTAWASFSATTDAGKRVPERYRLPTRRVEAGKLLIPVAFVVPDDDPLATLHLTSIVRLWPFRATWKLPA